MHYTKQIDATVKNFRDVQIFLAIQFLVAFLSRSETFTARPNPTFEVSELDTIFFRFPVGRGGEGRGGQQRLQGIYHIFASLPVFPISSSSSSAAAAAAAAAATAAPSAPRVAAPCSCASDGGGDCDCSDRYCRKATYLIIDLELRSVGRFRLTLSLFFFFLPLFSMSANAARKAFQRLPATVKPIHYNIRLKPDLKDFTFKGWINMHLQVLKETKTLVMNASELKVANIKLNSSVPIEEFSLDEEAETLTVELPEPLGKGQATVLCTYTGTLNDQMRGFYRSKYPAPDGGEERYCATTQFEATDARRCFPCWDEPSCKATFSISVIAPRDRTVHSNMPETEGLDSELDEHTAAEVDDDLKLVRFEKSPVMSTYLVAVVVGEFEGNESAARSKGNTVRVRSLTPKGKAEQGEFALKCSVKALEYYTEFFDVPYPLPKYECIALADFQCGAMENWGLVTYRETCVLVDPKNTSSASKQWIAVVVNHEMAHQWFGNLVTMEWWTHLWLNEGFASFMENQCTNVLFPEFDMWTQFVADTLIAALELDALDSSHPIEVEVGHPSEVDEIFDNISYNKGASVIRMLHDWIGNEAFRKGMKAYLERYSYKNAETGDLWKCLEEASGKPVGRVMTTWTGQMGFPIIVVDAIEQMGDEAKIYMRQEKFNADGKTSSGTSWQVPIKFATAGSDQEPESFLLDEEKTKLKVKNPSGGYIKLNDKFIGYYRVQYPPEYLEKFLPDIESKKLEELNRLSVLDDLMAIVQAGRASTDVALNMIKRCTGEESYVVWRCINNFFSKLRIILADEDYYKNFNEFILHTMTDIIDKIGWSPKEGEHHTQGLLRMMVIGRVGQLGHEKTVAEARRRFADYVAGKEEIPADLRAPIYRVVAASGGEDVFHQMVKLHNSVALHEEKDRIARAMGSFQNTDILQKVLAFAVGDDVRSQDTPFVVGSVGANPMGRDLAWEYVKSNYQMFVDRYKTGMLMNRLIKFTTDGFATEEKADEVEKFFLENKNPAERVVKQSVEGIRLNAAWLKRDGDKIRAFLQSQ